MSNNDPNDVTVRSVSTIVSAKTAVDFVKQICSASYTGLITALRLNGKSECIGYTHNRTDLDLAYTLGTVHDAVNEKGCTGIIIVYDKEEGLMPTDKEMSVFDDLHRKLSALQISLIDVITMHGKDAYSFADERIIQK